MIVEYMLKLIILFEKLRHAIDHALITVYNCIKYLRNKVQKDRSIISDVSLIFSLMSGRYAHILILCANNLFHRRILEVGTV
jgi:hypothetical protein